MAAGHVSAYALLLCVSSTIMVFYLIPEVKMSQKKKKKEILQGSSNFTKKYSLHEMMTVHLLL